MRGFRKKILGGWEGLSKGYLIHVIHEPIQKKKIVSGGGGVQRVSMFAQGRNRYINENLFPLYRIDRQSSY